MLFVLLCLVSVASADFAVWSHRCRQSGYAENDIDACRLASEIFDGIEVDVRWHGANFWLHHDHWYLATSTLEDLIKLDLPGGLWIDMKTSELESLPALLSLVENRSNVLVEVYDEKMLQPLENLTLTSTHLDTEIRSIWMPSYIFFGVDKERFMSWHMDYLCLMDTFFDSGGEVALTDLYYRPTKCSRYMSIVTARVLAWLLACLLACSLLVLTVLVCKKCVCFDGALRYTHIP